MTRKILSIDIRNDKIAALLIKTGLKGHVVEALSCTPIPEGSGDHEDFADRMILAFETAAKEMDLSGADVVLSLSPKMASYRNLRVPFKDRKKIRQVLPFEMEPTLPFSIEEMALDFQVVRPGPQTDIIACAVKRSDLNPIVAAFKSREMDPRAVTIGGLASAICLARFANMAPQFVYMDVDTDSCTLFAVVSGQIYLARTFQVTSEPFADKADEIIKHLVQFLAGFESFYDVEFKPSALCISGHDILPETLQQKLDPTMALTVQSVNVLDVLKTTVVREGLIFDPADFNNALGLAVIEMIGVDLMNLYGERTVLKRYWEEYKNDILKTGSIALFAFILFMFNVLLEARQLDTSIRHINQKIMLIFQSTFPDVPKIVDPVQQMRTKLQEIKEKTSYAGQIQDVILNIDILNEISQSIPPSLDVEFTQFVRGDDNILISGHTDTFNSVDEIKGKLEKSKLFKAITINSANLDAGSNRVQFKLKVDL